MSYFNESHRELQSLRPPETSKKGSGETALMSLLQYELQDLEKQEDEENDSEIPRPQSTKRLSIATVSPV